MIQKNDMRAGLKTGFAFRMTDNALNEKDQVIYCEETNHIENGSVVVVRLFGRYYARLYFKTSRNIHLKTLNKDYIGLTLDPKTDADCYQIIGVKVGALR